MLCPICLNNEGEIRNSNCECHIEYCQNCLFLWLSIHPVCTECLSGFILPDEIPYIQDNWEVNEMGTENILSIGFILLRIDDQILEQLSQYINNQGRDFIEIVTNIIQLIDGMSDNLLNDMNNIIAETNEDFSQLEEHFEIFNEGHNQNQNLRNLSVNLRRRFLAPIPDHTINYHRSYIDTRIYN